MTATVRCDEKQIPPLVGMTESIYRLMTGVGRGDGLRRGLWFGRGRRCWRGRGLCGWGRLNSYFCLRLSWLFRWGWRWGAGLVGDSWRLARRLQPLGAGLAVAAMWMGPGRELGFWRADGFGFVC